MVVFDTFFPFFSRDNKNNEQRGTEGTTYLQILSFDVESSQAADDTLALVSASNLNTMFKIEEERDIEKVTRCEFSLFILLEYFRVDMDFLIFTINFNHLENYMMLIFSG